MADDIYESIKYIITHVRCYHLDCLPNTDAAITRMYKLILREKERSIICFNFFMVYLLSVFPYPQDCEYDDTSTAIH